MKLLPIILLLAVVFDGPIVAEAACESYDNTPFPIPGNVVSLGLQANAVDKVGNYIELEPAVATAHVSFLALLSVWAPFSEWPAYCVDGWHQDIGLEIYDVAFVNGTAVTGTLLWSDTRTFLIPWRPEASPNCTGGRWLDPDGICRSGMSHLVLFPLNGTVLPATLIYGLATSTETYGPSPFGSAGPYNSLNIGLAAVPPSIGENVVNGTVFFDSPNSGSYGDGGPTGVFRLTEGWFPYTPMVRFVNDECYSACGA